MVNPGPLEQGDGRGRPRRIGSPNGFSVGRMSTAPETRREGRPSTPANSGDAPPPSRFTRARERYRSLAAFGFPARYPLVQFPNPPLWVALLASAAGWFVDGEPQRYVTAVGTVGIAVWAWLEVFEGVNLARRLLGLVVLVHTVVTLADRFV